MFPQSLWVPSPSFILISSAPSSASSSLFSFFIPFSVFFPLGFPSSSCSPYFFFTFSTFSIPIFDYNYSISLTFFSLLLSVLYIYLFSSTSLYMTPILQSLCLSVFSIVSLTSTLRFHFPLYFLFHFCFSFIDLLNSLFFPVCFFFSSSSSLHMIIPYSTFLYLLSCKSLARQKVLYFLCPITKSYTSHAPSPSLI